MELRAFCIAFLASALAIGAIAEYTALDEYMALPDPQFVWDIYNISPGPGYTMYTLNMTSQQWLTESDSSASIWKHWVQVCVPDGFTGDEWAYMYIDGGPNVNSSAESGMELLPEWICQSAKTISVALLEVPNEPVYFWGEKPYPKRRTEDGMIAYTWWHYINNPSEPFWLARLPMTKATVRAMDAVQWFVNSTLGVDAPQKFLISGASKRGWETWMVACVDPRVGAIVPMVMPILNIVPNINHHFQAYGNWSFALSDYYDLNLMSYINEPIFAQMASIIDPFSYLDRMTMPKMVLTASGDEFFLPDSPQFFFHDLLGTNYLKLIPDADHPLFTAYADVGTSIATFYEIVRGNAPYPVLSWTMVKSNTSVAQIVLTVQEPLPVQVTMWSATTLSNVYRDFRLFRCADIVNCLQPIIWNPTVLEPQPDGTYLAEQSAPAYGGWTGFLIIAQYDFNGNVLHIGSEMNIVPDIMPFPPCEVDNRCGNNNTE